MTFYCKDKLNEYKEWFLYSMKQEKTLKPHKVYEYKLSSHNSTTMKCKDKKLTEEEKQAKKKSMGHERKLVRT